MRPEHNNQLLWTNSRPQSMALQRSASSDEPELRGAKELLGIDGVKHVIFGHTHTEIDGADEQAKVKNYFNTGSWVGSIDLSKRENRKRLSRLSGADLKDDSLFDLRFRTAMIEVDNLGTRVELQRLDI